MRGLDDFIGSYTVERSIKDARAGHETRFEGHAQIERNGDAATYREVGHLIMGDQQFEAERRYVWRAQADRIAVLFEDGRPFHDFDPNTGGNATEHLCGEDIYRGGYDFSEWPRWVVTWDVQGPRKDYTSVTSYVRK